MKTARTAVLALAALLILPGFAAAPAIAAPVVVNMPDPELRACLNSRLGQPAEAEITAEQLARLQAINCSGRPIADLTGIEYMSAAYSLGFYETKITDLTPLTTLPRLTILNVVDAPLSDLGPLRALPQLTSLGIDNTQVGDLSPLTGLQALNTLRAENTPITSITPLAGLPLLQYVQLGGNVLSDVSTLATLPALTDLILRPVPEVLPATIPPLPGLTRLTIENSTVVDANRLLAGSPKLQYARLDNTRIADLGGFQAGELRELILSNSLITDPTPLAVLATAPGFTYGDLDLSGNRIADIGGLAGAWEKQKLVLSGQRVTLPAQLLGVVQENPVRTLDGSPLIPTSTGGGVDIDPVTGNWVFTEPGAHTLSWDDAQQFPVPPGTGPGYYIFTGAILQEATRESDLSVTDPRDLTVTAGQDATFTSTASSTGGTLSVSWQSSPDGETWTTIPGATHTTLTVPAAEAVTGTRYRALHKNDVTGQEALSTSALLTVTPAVVGPPTTPEPTPPTTVPPTDPADRPGGGLAGTGAEQGPLFLSLGLMFMLLLAGAGLLYRGGNRSPRGEAG
ncbi:leucine-rich repeat domain-containing protein [Mycetocola spongiae]|uniref:leucine-rich repeat domain-containing protein n=1 Tax=Mycetocola spongiae TaxID=2859226 RepID=UPI001CF5C86E|nr:hypothetical protein [Mycetocola spongiae]UCR89674.1 hypothetical protein KXZ72_03050 [Mycetocola spongiae]